MLKFDESKLKDNINGALKLRTDIEEITDHIIDAGFETLFFVGVGGTYASAVEVVNYMHGKSQIPVFAENAAVLLARGNTRFKEGAVMIFSSVSGTTEEMIRVTELAKQKGVRTFAFIDKSDSPLAQMVDHCISYPKNEQLKLFMTAHRFMMQAGEFPEYESYYKQLDDYLAEGLIACEKQADSFGREFAEKHYNDAIHYFVGAGIQWGAVYSYAMCYWEEMHWIKTKSIHAAEFFHGMFEIVERDTNITVFIAEDEERCLAERVAKFLPRICANYTIIDTKDYPLEGIDEKFRGLLSHLVMHAITNRIDAHIEQISRHPMEIRRYYRQLNY